MSSRQDFHRTRVAAYPNTGSLAAAGARPRTAVRASRRSRHAHLACVIPMYNESGHAERFLRELYAFAATRFRQVTIVVIDDGSRDATSAEVYAAIERGLPVHFIRLSRNFGKEVALTAGLAATERLASPAEVVLIMDADFQHPFSAVDEMIERWEGGTDMAYGVQMRRGADGPVRRAMTWAFYRLMHASGGRFTIPRDAGDFRLLDRCVVHAINRLPERARYMKGLYAWVGFTSDGVPFEAMARSDGRSSFGFARLSELALDGLTAFTSWPLRVSSIVGFFVSLSALAYGLWIVFERLVIGQPIPGFATVVAAIMFLSGIQLISIGLLGEYLARVFLEVKGRPLYVIAEEVDCLHRAEALDRPAEYVLSSDTA